MRKTIHYIDMFAGMGGFREGLTRAGDFVCMGHCEIDKYADRSYRALFDTEGEWFIDDARKADPETMPDFELLCGGFPCQAFSLAGNRRGFGDPRGTLFFELARLAEARKPRYLLFENVPGLLSHDGGRTFATILHTLDRLGYGDERNPIVAKSEFVLSLYEQLVGGGQVTAKEKSILGRCTELVYQPYIRNGYQGTPPTLRDFYRLLKLQPEPEAQGLALASELFITGTLNTFAKYTNVDTQARIIDYDIRELGEQLMPLGMLVTLDAIYNRVIQNQKHGKRTWIIADEFYILFRYEYSANFFYKLWKRIRKYNGLITGLTQNVDELLRSDTARLMLANSEFLILLNQSATDREELAKLLHISDTQLGYITDVPAGCGLIRCGGQLVPFTNAFPTGTDLYRLMSTRPGEMLN